MVEGDKVNYCRIELTRGQLLGEKPEETIARIDEVRKGITDLKEDALDTRRHVGILIEEFNDAINTLPLGTEFTVRSIEGHNLEIHSLETDERVGTGNSFIGGRRTYDMPDNTLMLVSAGEYIIVEADDFLETYDIEVKPPKYPDQLDN
jgi:hypothetical protein